MSRSSERLCIHTAVEAQHARRPHAVAVEFEGRSLSYAELNERANRLANLLIARGIGPDDRVAVYLDRSLDMVVVLLGTLKAGAGYVPMDPAYPGQRIAAIMEDAEPKLVLTLRERVVDLPASVPALCLDEIDSELSACDPANPGVEMDDQRLAYVIFTSGSTGRPKGVMITHRNVMRLFSSTSTWYGFGPDDVWVLAHSYGFDVSVWEIWGALTHGGRIIVIPTLVSWLPEALFALLSERRVTVLNQTPSAFRKLLQADETMASTHPLALRLVIFAGEALELGMLRGWFGRHGDVRPQLVNMYGITETTVHVSYRPISEADVRAEVGSVIGRAIPDLEMRIYDEQMRAVGTGEIGEIFVGGPGLARGYIGRPELTAQRFVCDPERPDARLYRSGDLARHRADGELEYLGRIDNQVKIRGFRIELGEIESALGAHPQIRAAVVVVQDNGSDDKTLVAFVAARVGETLDEDEILDRLSERLPKYMTPARVIVVGALPLNVNGKVDRAQLLGTL